MMFDSPTQKVVERDATLLPCLELQDRDMGDPHVSLNVRRYAMRRNVRNLHKYNIPQHKVIRRCGWIRCGWSTGGGCGWYLHRPVWHLNSKFSKFTPSMFFDQLLDADFAEMK